MEDLKGQAERFGTEIRYEYISKVDFTAPVHKIWTESGEEIQAYSVIISTGADAKWLGLESEERFKNNGVSACAVCDGFFFRGQEVAVVGGGDTAAEEATYLAKLCTKVHLLVRRGEMRASKIMQERVQNTANLTVHWHSETVEIQGDETVQAIKIRNVLTKEEQTLPVTGFFVAIGHKPNTDIFKGWLNLDEAGYIITEGKSSKTNIAGVFASGDAQDNVYRQAITAAGTGCMAALDAERYLAANNLH
jgi:thioredoxin reductase (NADPH)